jgi:hypothetical protein
VKITNDTMNVFAIQSIKTYSTYLLNVRVFMDDYYIYNNNFERTVTAYKYITNGPCAQKSYPLATRLILIRREREVYF